MAITVQLFDRRTKRLIACLPFDESEGSLDRAIATAKAQKQLAIVSNGKVEGAYLDGQIVEVNNRVNNKLRK